MQYDLDRLNELVCYCLTRKQDSNIAALQNATTVPESQLCTYSKEEVSDAALPQIDSINSDKSVKYVWLQTRISLRCYFLNVIQLQQVTFCLEAISAFTEKMES